MTFSSTASTDDGVGTVRHLVAFLPTPPAHLWLRALGGHVSLLPTVTTLGGLRAVGHHVTFLLASPAFLGLRAVRGEVAFLDTWGKD